MADTTPYISIEDVSFGYDRSRPLFSGLNISFVLGSTTLLTGANGAGKTSLVKLIMGILRADGGKILVSGKEAGVLPLHEMAGLIALSPQKAEYQLFLTSVQKEIAFGPEKLSRPERDRRVSEAMELFALGEHAEKHPYDLHPSRRKLLSLASAVAMDTPFLIFDEPTSGLSKPEKEILRRSLAALRAKGKGYILVTHDLSFGITECERIVVLKGGACVADESIEAFVARPGAEILLRKAGSQLPVATRLSRHFGHHPVAKTATELVSLIKAQTYGH